MKKLLFILVSAAFVLNSFGPAAQVEDFTYSVSMDGKLIGTYAVSKTEIEGRSTFRVETNTAAGLIGRMEHRFVMLSSFNNKKLISADLKTWVNQELESSSVLQWDGKQYIKHEGEKLTEISCDLVDYSSASVFFEEPIDRESLFYEKYGKELMVSQVETHKYEVKLPNGGIERYAYKNGKVREVQFVQTFATITLQASN